MLQETAKNAPLRDGTALIKWNFDIKKLIGDTWIYMEIRSPEDTNS